MKRLLILIAFVSTVAFGKQFDGCGITFSYPDAWHAELNPREKIYLGDYKKKDVRCAIGLRPPGWVQKNDASPVDRGNWAITIAIVDRPFLEVAWKVGFLRSEQAKLDDGTLPLGLKPGGWAISVRQGEAPALQFHTACCQAVRGGTWGHGEARDGSVATVTSELAVLNDRRSHSVILEAFEDETFSKTITQIVESFRFAQ